LALLPGRPRHQLAGGTPSKRGIPILPGLVGSVAAFFSVGALNAPWPWLWILLPLFLDPYCVPGLFLLRRR
jgi:hypothetical protein